ncbi:GNAT family N-acetyltransferase [Salsipaludibacter albus]|uniref:GNAT family N-acetyltransferase n=1 Tax=Salsipaludibacter albus TaxID=2849650 RepID=UPI001EE464AA
MHVRAATAEDLPAIVELLADDELGRTREDPDDLGTYRAAFAAIDQDPNQELVVLDDDGRPIGTLQLSLVPSLTHRGSWRGQVEGVRVAADRRGEGLGAVLLRWAIDRAATRGCRMVQLTTDRRRPDAHRFYESLGFTATHLGMKLALDGEPRPGHGPVPGQATSEK